MAWAFNPTVNSPIDEYALKLREKYNKTLTRYKDPDINKYPAAGPTAPAVPFIPPKLIRLKNHQEKADAEFLHSIDKEILKHDNFEKIKIGDLLKPLRDKPLKFVLIEGEPGIGKSTLVKELALRWAKRTDKLLNNFKILFFIPLRLEIYQKAESIEDLIDVECINIISLIKRARGAGVLWILDGFDELPHHLRKSSTSIFIKLIKGDILPKSTVIVTSRHAATDPLLIFLEDDSKHIALRGFGSTEILKYASKYFKNQVVLFEFQSHYSGSTVIENMLYNPMNCFIMCKIFTDFIHTKNNNKYPITMTAIYNYYVRALLKRHLIDAQVIDINYEMPPHLIREIDFNISKLNDTWEDFYYLSRVAYKGVIKQEYVFGKELHNVSKLSMMDTIISFTGFDKDESSSFIHTTLQDYFAAIYLVNNPGSMFTETDMNQNSNLEDVLIFYVGLSKHIDRKIGTLDMLRTNVFHGSYNLIYLGISSLLLRCIYENDLLLHNQDYNLDFGHTWSIANVPMNNFDYFIAGYIAATHNITLRINVSHATQLTAFKKGLQFQQNSVNGKINIRLHYLDFSRADPVAEVDLPSDAVIGLNLMLDLDVYSICQIISKFPLLEELLIKIDDKFDCHSTILEHPLMKLKELERLAIVIMTYNYKSILEILKQFVVPERPLKI
ncbi:PREDICTED: NACHT, LRR and PYD domains-containing protein 3-like [Amphimedon queenslandica]|uniref:NACHT domain-containing protein n=1 Tax=Amphimedon queenslandica TaxID=400682 RepID=A0A1X7SSS8_AMPQE|nr:PREDICTED: NACHT, LRR and PYD domains-containing protein 3-like [Amphimedon queenslandica]|eukprot:XP_019862885.1 PREDICTED: NACHT, LRR and PYD domains-containing protein 3-like [Amphimedon queenslandica]